MDTLRRFVTAQPSDTETHRPAMDLRISSQPAPVKAATDAIKPSGMNTPRNGSVHVGTLWSVVNGYEYFGSVSGTRYRSNGSTSSKEPAR